MSLPDDQFPSDITEILLNDPFMLDCVDKSSEDNDKFSVDKDNSAIETDNDEVDWDPENNGFADFVLPKMEIEVDSAPYDFLFGDEDFTSAAVTALTDENINSDNSASENESHESKPDDATIQLDFLNGPRIKKETNELQLLNSTSLTEEILPNQFKNPFLIVDNMSKSIFTPTNVLNVVYQNDKYFNTTTKDERQNQEKKSLMKSSNTMALELDNEKVSKISDTRNSVNECVYTQEEKEMFEKLGFTLPTCYPVTKQDEKNLKLVKRKIKNKMLAKISRERQKLHVDDLENKVKQYTDENAQLKDAAKALQTQNTYIKETIIKCIGLVDLLGDTSNSTFPTYLMEVQDLIGESNLEPTETDKKNSVFLEGLDPEPGQSIETFISKPE